MSSKRVALLLAALFCLFAVTPSSLFGQAASTGTVAGTVTDPSGGAIVGATVTLTDTATNSARTEISNDTGRYFFANVVPSKYTVAVSKTGFRVSKLVDQVVSVGASLTLNLTLEIGSVAETVEVTATNGAELQTLNATVGNTVGGELLQNLPSIGRDAATFVTLQPGVSPDGSVAGAVVDQSTFMLDGGQNTNDMDGSMQVYTPSFAGDPSGGIVSTMVGGSPTGVMPTPIDSVEEFKVNTANQTADFNSSAGAQVQVVTRRGTNAWHGSAYEYYFDNNLNANTWNNNITATPLPSYHYNRFGASGGGPIISRNILGGKTYFFANYEGFRWNNSQTYEAIVPSANMRAGILTMNVCDAACEAPGGPAPVPTLFNLNTGVNCGPGQNAACDPRDIGINSLVQQMWNKYEPIGNDPGCNVVGLGTRCDGVNTIGYKANVAIPYTSNFGVARLDHDFGSKFHFNTSYRYYKLVRSTTSQVDVGGFFSGDTLGTPAALSVRPQQPWYFVAGLTINVTSNTTNDLHYSFLRNYWSWSNPGGAPQFSQLGTDVGGAALEPFGETANPLAPYNVNTQSVRTRFWDGHDNFLRDDWTMLKGNHLFTFGGAYQRNWDWHQRSDNGGGINYQATYQLGDSAGGGLINYSSTLPPGVSASQWGRDVSAVLGIVTDSQIAYTRSGSDLALNAPLTHAFDQSTIPYYNVYFSDSWHMKPSFTLTYGLGWTLEMPPTEAAGKQIELVDQSGQQVDTQAYLKQRQIAALAGQVYNPILGYSLVGNTGAGQKYPYDPFYGSFSPRVAAAWNPNMTDGWLGKAFGGNKTVIRGGYSRVYGRLNGVDLVLVPLLGDGLIQAVQCRNNNMNGTCSVPAGSSQLTPANAFRIGTDGNNAPIPAASPTLPQLNFPGINSVAAGAGEVLDPHFRPNVVDSFDLTIQRQLGNKFILELGYIGRRITHEYQPINLNAVPYMMTLGGQQFAKAYAAVEKGLGCATSFAACGAAIPSGTANQVAYANTFAPQPFFESALAGTGYCAGFSSCTAAVVYNEGIAKTNLTTQSVWNLWSDLDNGGFNFPRSMMNTPIDCPPNSGNIGCGGQTSSGVSENASLGHGNYNGAFVSLKMNNWKGITLQENFTYSKALGTGALVQATSEYTPNNAFDLNAGYGLQNFNRKFVFNTYAMIDDPWYKGQHGVIGHLLGGWSVSPILAIGSGEPLGCGTFTDSQSFGAGDGANFFDTENCILTKPASGSSASLHADGAGQYNIFANPSNVLSTLRAPILGLDSSTGGVGVFTGLMYWNVDMRLVKNIKVTERVQLQFEYTVTNLFNHPVFEDPTVGDAQTGIGVDPTNAATFGVVNTQGNNPRQMQFGLRLTF